MPGLFEQFPHTNLHELNLDWIIDLINQFKEELENSAVLSVNGETGHVTLYESENVILPALPSGVDQWRLVRMMNGQYAGILFYNGNVYLQRGNSNMRLLTLEDIPTSAGVVSWNGLTGVVNVTGSDIKRSASSQVSIDQAITSIDQAITSIDQAITNEQVERVNADNGLNNKISNLISIGLQRASAGTDADTIYPDNQRLGFFAASYQVANLPSQDWYFLLSFRFEDTYITQLALGMTGNGVYWRKFNIGATNTPWIHIDN